jgi:hypothetical protein
MKMMILSIALLTSFNLFACPDLAGEYECEAERSGVQRAGIVTQGSDSEGDYIQLSMSDDKIYLDGTDRTNSDGKWYNASCAGESIIINTKKFGFKISLLLTPTADGHKVVSSGFLKDTVNCIEI